MSIVVPCFNEEKSIPLFYKEFNKVTSVLKDKVEFEFIFVDDGSKDKTMEEIHKLCKVNKSVYYVSFSRNFGKEAAIYAGLKKSTGDYIVLMDADLQDPPALLPEMYDYVKNEDFDSVATRRVTRKGEPLIRSFFARLFYKIMKHISQADMVDGARDYRLMTRKFVNALLDMSEYNRFSKGLFGWVGFKTKWIEFENVERVAGETKWSFWGLFKYSLEGIIAFSTFPLTLSSIFGFISCLLAFCYMIFIVISKLFFGNPVAGWSSLVCIVLFLGGIQLMSIGVLGMYLSKTYLETKKRPVFIIADTNMEEKP
ncbi:Glycosyltransferase involved in cell wall bisynthesis [Acetitomaculum ruminis DSM 5522]|uniref:Glycosyltransferase involved in cell wall bisynthesis n=1 Tax=Acetitomaculum ruminis DSM 5522 TaxID=1120918 RepID=A0A1I0ZW43_9FIRM|nr:glycosyltransferase family 2 protein [Acetitomaculum ruminis]SFB29984.1 Glycosyltransferase involved in cell wall bisynthesis [Acetitomaculum ruminis DSM 5522]